MLREDAGALSASINRILKYVVIMQLFIGQYAFHYFGTLICKEARTSKFRPLLSINVLWIHCYLQQAVSTVFARKFYRSTKLDSYYLNCYVYTGCHGNSHGEHRNSIPTPRICQCNVTHSDISQERVLQALVCVIRVSCIWKCRLPAWSVILYSIIHEPLMNGSL